MPPNVFYQFDSSDTASAPSRNVFDQFDQPQQSQSRSSVLGPISDVAELGARGINWAAQQLPESIRPAPRQSQPLGTQFSIGGWTPSTTGMAQSLYQTGKGAVTLPGDVYAGRVDPLSEEGIRRAADLATMAPTGTIPSVLRRAPTGTALTTAELERQGDIGYNILKEGARDTAVPPAALDAISQTVRQRTLEGPSPKLAPKTYTEIEALKTPRIGGDLGDLLETRQNLRALVREGGNEGTAALKAVEAIDDHLGEPLSNIVKNLDQNWAIMRGSQEVETAIRNAIKEAGTSGSGGNVGNKIKQALRPMLKNEKLSPEVRTAIERAVNTNTLQNLMRAIAIFDPTTHKLGLMGTVLASSPAHWMTGGVAALPHAALAGGGFAARAFYDRMMRNRAAAVTEAMRRESPLSMAQPGFGPGRLVQRQQPLLPSPSIPLLPDYRQP